jgi:hypothetical protein
VYDARGRGRSCLQHRDGTGLLGICLNKSGHAVMAYWMLRWQKAQSLLLLGVGVNTACVIEIERKVVEWVHGEEN